VASELDGRLFHHEIGVLPVRGIAIHHLRVYLPGSVSKPFFVFANQNLRRPILQDPHKPGERPALEARTKMAT